MQTVMLRSKVRKSADSTSFIIEALGESAVQEKLKDAIRDLEYHPARVARRTIIDMMSLIEAHNLQIRYAERQEEEEGQETWTFILQG